MTPFAVGFDLVDVDRVARLIERKAARALARLLTEPERVYCLGQAVPARHIAARLAAKEAAYKALAHGGDVGTIGWREVEVARELTGGPTLVFHGRARETARRLHVVSSLVSLSHTGQTAGAVVLLFT